MMAHRRSSSPGQYDSPEYDYSDSFASDEDAQPKRNMNRKQSGPKKKRNALRGQGRQARSSQEFSDNITRKMMSAKMLKINELRNRIEELNSHVVQLRDENKLLKKMQHRQEKALVKFEHEESDLPQLIQRHNNETRNLKEILRKTRDKYERTDRYLRDAEDELDKVKSKLRKYKTLAEDKHLPEREELNKKLHKLDLFTEEKDIKIQDLEKHIKHLNKNHRHELGIEIARNRETQKQLDQAREEKESLQQQIREKEKELEVKNIYANRMINQPRRMPASYGGTPNETPQPPRMRKRAPSLEATPRDKMKQYEEKRRQEAKKQREIQQRAKEKASKEREVTYKWTEDPDDFEKREEETERHKREVEDWENSVLQRRLKEESEERTLQQERERIKRESENRLEKERMEREKKEKEARLLREQLQNEESERRQYELRELEKRDQEIKERERRERERHEREEQDRIEKHERNKQRAKEIEEQERRAREERERLQFDQNTLEERRKKDEILAKLRAIDEGQNKKSTTVENPIFMTSNNDSTSSTPTSKKSYSFTKPVENMHHGLPSHEDITVPYLEKQKQKRNQTSEAVGYQPSFGSGKRGGQKDRPSFLAADNDIFGSKSSQKEAKSNLMKDLFGGEKKSGTSNPVNGFDDDFFSTPKKKTSAQRSSFPWEDDSKLVHGKHGTQRENSSTLIGGGSALIEDNDGRADSSKLLPRRQRQPLTTFHTRPAVTAVDNIEDDIEEVIL